MSRLKSPEGAEAIMWAANFTPLQDYPGAEKAWKCRCDTYGKEVASRLSTVQMGAE